MTRRRGRARRRRPGRGADLVRAGGVVFGVGLLVLLVVLGWGLVAGPPPGWLAALAWVLCSAGLGVALLGVVALARADRHLLDPAP